MLVVVVGLALFFSYLGRERIVSPDEGFYGLASRLTAEGKHPYRDFFYPQMPLLPYIYGAWVRLAGSGLGEQRVFSVLCCVVVGLLIHIHISKRRGIAFALIGVSLYATSPLVFPWFPVLKTYALSVAFLAAALVLLDLPLRMHWKLRWFLAGLCLGAAAGVRLYFAAAIPILALHAGRTDGGFRRFPSRCLWLSGGLLLSMAPAIWLLVSDFESFWYSNVGYHLGRSNMTPSGEQRRRIKVLQVMFGLTRGETYHGVQLPILFYAATAHLALAFILRRVPSAAVLVAATLVGVSLVPSPVYLQYMAVAVPFLAICAADLLAEAYSLRFIKANRGMGLATIGLTAALLVAYLAPLRSDLNRYTETGAGIAWIKRPRHAADWKLDALEDAAAFIDEHTQPSETIVALWPGHLLGTHATIYPRLENNFGLNGAAALPLGEGARYHVMHIKEVLEVIAAHGVRTVVFYDRSTKDHELARGRTLAVKKALADARYWLVGESGRVKVYQEAAATSAARAKGRD